MRHGFQFALVAGALALGGCATPSTGGSSGGAPAPAPVIVVSGNAQTVVAEAQRELARFGAVQTGPLTLRAPYKGNGEIANCPPVTIKAQRRSRVASATGGFVELLFVDVPGSETPRTRVDVRFAGQYSAPGTAGSFERPCQSTGVVERELAELAAGA